MVTVWIGNTAYKCSTRAYNVTVVHGITEASVTDSSTHALAAINSTWTQMTRTILLEREAQCHIVPSVLSILW